MLATITALLLKLFRLMGLYLYRIGGVDIREINKRQNYLATKIHEVVILIECEKADATHKVNALLSKYPDSSSSFFDYDNMEPGDRDLFLNLSGRVDVLSMLQSKTLFLRLEL